jgi:glutathione synthase/RimK-type ligase-like ATP-grasp enzyme
MTNVWVLVNDRETNLTNYNNVSIVNEFVKRGMNCEAIHFSSLTTSNGALVYKNNDQVQLTAPDLVFINNKLPDLRFVQTDTGLRYSKESIQNYDSVIDALKNMKPKTLFVNDLVSHSIASLKHNIYSVIKQTNVPMPKTIIFDNENEASDLLSIIKEELQFPIVIKGTEGSGGNNVELYMNEEDLLNDMLNGKSLFQIKYMIFQQYEKDSEGLLIKVRLVGDKIEAVYRLYSPYTNETFKGEEAIGRIAVAMNVDQDLCDAVYAAAAALNIEIGWFDFFLSKGVYKFCEVNVPGGIFNSIFNNTDFAVETVDYCLKRLEEYRNGQ